MTVEPPRVNATKFERAPLVHVLAQVRYAPVLTISRSIPAIQEGLKKAGFPRYAKGEAQNIVFKPGAPPRIDTVERWDFLTRDKKTGVILTPEFVLLQTTAYETFQQFGELLRAVFDVVGTSVEIDIVERLGIRYVDVVRVDEGESFSSYLKPGLVGFPFSEILDPEFQQAISTTQSVAVANLANSTLNVKCFQLGDGTFLPPDLAASGLEYDMSLNPQEVVTILDFDHFRKVDTEFVPERLVEELDGLHQTANKAFRAALMPFAYQKWGGNAQ